MTTDKEIQILCKHNFVAFLFFIFSKAIDTIDGEFVPGKHLIDWGRRLQLYKRTITISARFHLKSTTAISFLAWQLYRAQNCLLEWEYICYIHSLAEYHIKKLKRYLSVLSEFADFQQLTDAESRIHYYNHKKNVEFILTPSGILSFNRGRHPDGIICDDILCDPTSYSDISQLKKIERIFLEDIEAMPKEQLHIFGTPQHPDDLFATLAKTKGYNVKKYPTNIEKPLWPQKYNSQFLIDYKSRVGQKAFNKEFLCIPAASEDSFLKEKQLDAIIEPRLKNYSPFGKPLKLNNPTFAGFDIGKKTHPSHLSVIGIDRKKKLLQICSFWLDNVPYIEQIEILKKAIERFNIELLYYDNTRAEFEGFEELGDLPPQMQPFIFSLKNKFTLAAQLDRIIEQKDIKLLQDERQKRQLLNVNNALQCMETEEGHGDCFFSLALAIKAFQEGNGEIAWEL